MYVCIISTCISIYFDQKVSWPCKKDTRASKIQVMTYELHSFVCHHQSHQKDACHHMKSIWVDKKLPRLLVYLSHTFVKRLNLGVPQKTKFWEHRWWWSLTLIWHKGGYWWRWAVRIEIVDFSGYVPSPLYSLRWKNCTVKYIRSAFATLSMIYATYTWQ